MRFISRAIILVGALTVSGWAHAASEGIYHCQVLRVIRGNPIVIGEMLVDAYSTQPKIVRTHRSGEVALCAGTDPRQRPTLVCGFSREEFGMKFVRVEKSPQSPAVIMAVTRNQQGIEDYRALAYAATRVGSYDLHSILPMSEPLSQMQISCTWGR